MNLFQKYGIKEVADVTFYSINTIGDEEIYTPVLFLDTLKVSTLEKSAEKSSAEGGKGNKRLITWNYGKQITLNLEDALFTPASMSMIWGGQLDSRLSPYTSAIAKSNIANKYGKLNYSTKAYPSPAFTDEEWEIVFRAATDIDYTVGGTAPQTLIEEVQNNPGAYTMIPYATNRTSFDVGEGGTNVVNVQLGWLLLKKKEVINDVPSTVRINNLVIKNSFADEYEGYFIYTNNYDTTIIEVPSLLKANYSGVTQVVSIEPPEPGTSLTGLVGISPNGKDGPVALTDDAHVADYVSQGYSFGRIENDDYYGYHSLQEIRDNDFKTGFNGSQWGYPPGRALGGFSSYLGNVLPGGGEPDLKTIFTQTVVDSVSQNTYDVFWVGDNLPEQDETLDFKTPNSTLTCTIKYLNESVETETAPTEITNDSDIIDKLTTLKNIYWVPNYVQTADTAFIEEHRTQLRKSYFNRTLPDDNEKAMSSSIIQQVMAYINNLKQIGTIETQIYDTEVIDRMEKCIVTNKKGLKISTKEQKKNYFRYLQGDETSSYIIYYDAKTMLPLFNISGDGLIQGWDAVDENNEFIVPPHDRDFNGKADQDTFVLKMGTVYYKWSRTVKYKAGTDDGILGRTFVIDAETFPDTYKIVGETYIREQKTGKDQRYQFTIHRANVSTDTSITLQADGDPTTFNMSVDVLTPPNDIMMELKQYDVDEDKLHGGDRIVPQRSRYTYTAVNIDKKEVPVVNNPEMY